MPKRVAVLSDIHGVLPALEAVLAEQDVSAAVERSGYQGVAAWADYFIRARATDAEALNTFGQQGVNR